MANRDYEERQHERDEGRFERGERGFREQNYRGLREWERRADAFGERDATGYDPRARQDGGPNWYDDGRDARRAWSSSADRWQQGSSSRPQQSYYGRDWGHGPTGHYGYDRDRDFSGSTHEEGREDVRRRPYGGESAYARQSLGPHFGAGSYDWGDRPEYRREGYASDEHRHGESWSQQLRHGAQQMANRVKRAFRGPKGYKRSDERIREDVSDRLALQDQVDPSDVEVTVQAGEVTLTGTVQNRHEKFLVEEIADDVSGVTEVHNQLRVRRADTGASSGVVVAANDPRNRNARA